MLKPPLGCQARKGVSKAIGEQVFLDSVDAALDVDFDVPCRRQPDPCDFAQYKKRATHPNPGSVAFVVLPEHPDSSCATTRKILFQWVDNS